MPLTPEQRRERATELAERALDDLAEDLAKGRASEHLYGLALAHFEVLAGQPPQDFYQREIYDAAQAAVHELQCMLEDGELPSLACFLRKVAANSPEFHEWADEEAWEELEDLEDQAAEARRIASEWRDEG